MGKVLSLVSGRGGTGKSVLAVCIGARLIARNQKVLLIDMNAGMRCLDQLMKLDQDVVYDLMDVSDGRSKSKKTILISEGQADLLPASQTRGLQELDLPRFIRLLEQLREKYDYILLDTASGWNLSSRISCNAADQIIIVETPDGIGSRGADRMKALLREEMAEKPLSILLNRYCPDAVSDHWQITPTELQELTGVEVIGWIPEDAKLRKRSMTGELSAFTDGKASSAIMRICRRVMGEQVKLEDPALFVEARSTAESGIFRRWFRKS